MISLLELTSRHAPLLLMDAASARIQVGWLEGPDRAAWSSSEAEAGTGLFQAIQSLGADPMAAGAFVFAAGPGSVLGVRTVAIAIRTWSVLAPRPAFSYNGLAVAAEACGRPGLALIADARRNAWHWHRRGGPVLRMPTEALSGPLAMPEGFRMWSAPPPGLERVSYDLAQLFAIVAAAPLFEPAAQPDAFLHEEPSYVTWNPQMHRAP